MTSLGKETSASKQAPKFYRIDWRGVDLPRQPSLRLVDDEFFFQLINYNNNRDGTEKKRNRFLDFLSRAAKVNVSKKYHALAAQKREASTKEHTPVPLHIRKLEIELIQRKLPRYPSQSHLSDPSFYPLLSCDLFESREPKQEKSLADLPKKKGRKKEVSFGTTTTTEIEIECLEDEEDPLEYNTSTIQIDIGCLEDEEDHDFPETEAALAEQDDDYSSTTEIEIESSEDEQDYDFPETQEKASELRSVKVNEDDTSTTAIEIDHLEDEDEFFEGSYYDESYYSESNHSRDSDYSEDEVEMEVDCIFKELLQMKEIHFQRIENTDQQMLNSSPEENESVEWEEDEIIECEVDESSQGEAGETIEPKAEKTIPGRRKYADDETRKYVYKPPWSSIAYAPRLISDDVPYEIRIGFVPPMIRAMIFQARMELRSRKVPEEHVSKLKPSLAQASALGRSTRLDEHTVEAVGRKYVKHDDFILPSAVWVKGQETVSLPAFKERTLPQFIIFQEAVALGGIKALKPEITTNYDQFAPTNYFDDDEMDIDDANRHKLIRTRYLTDMFLHEDHRSVDDDDLESVHYDSLDDVELPSNINPVYACSEAKATKAELKDLIAQQVAEAVWDRRYRLERPRAKQRIKYRCTCKYCKTSSPYQTFAYRKRWLVQQNLWKEPAVDDPMKEANLETTNETPMDDANEGTDLEGTTIGKSTHVDPQINSEGEEVETSVGISVKTNSFALEEFELTENNTSVILEVDEDGFDKRSYADMVDGSSPYTKSVSTRADDDRLDTTKSTVDMDADSSPPQKQKVNRTKAFMREIQTALGISEHSSPSSTQVVDGGRTPLDKREKISKKSKRSIKNGIKSMRSLFSNSSHGTETKHSVGFARAA